MNTIIWLILIIAVWVILAKYVLPKMGFEG
jgi:hypothetical protein